MKKMQWTIQGTAALAGAIGVMDAILCIYLTQFTSWPMPLQIVIALICGFISVFLSSRLLFSHVSKTVQMLESGLSCYKDGDFTIQLHTNPLAEFGDIIRIFNQLGDVLDSKHADLFQRELLLQTIISHSRMGIVLRDSWDYIVISNPAAETLLGKAPLKGQHWPTLLQSADETVRNAFESPDSELVRLHLNGHMETLMISENPFRLRGLNHKLLMFNKITREFANEEVRTWKKIIRLINHELANTLGPLKSLVHSAQKVSRNAIAPGNTPNSAQTLPRIYDSMDEILDHLHAFLQGYADFARLPQPRISIQSALEFVEKLSPYMPNHMDLPENDFQAAFDPAQIQQVIINLLKNARESESPEEGISFRLLTNPNETWEMVISDKGKGMAQDTLSKVTLPFFSTKPNGSGLGLALCREITEAHHGELRIHSVKNEGTRVRIILPVNI